MKNLNISTKKIDGVVLRYAESGDYNKIFTILTSEDKKISLFAPNVKRAKKGQGAPEVLDICQFEIIESNENLNKLKDFKFIENYKNLRENFKKLCVSMTLMECTNNLIKEYDECKNAFNLIKNTLNVINKESEELKIFKHLYDCLFSLLVILGFEDSKRKLIASKNNLIQLLNKIIEISETNLKSLNMLMSILPQKKSNM